MFQGSRLYGASSWSLRRPLHLLVAAGLWLLLGLGATGGSPAIAQAPGSAGPQGYYIVMSPSGVPYTVPIGSPLPGGAVWPYREMPPTALGLGRPPAQLPRPGVAAPAAAPPFQLRPFDLSRPPAAPSGPAEMPPLPAAPAVDFGAPPEPAVSLEDPLDPTEAVESAAETASEPSEAGPKVYKDGIYAIDKDYLLSYPQNAWRILSSPFNFDQEDWLIVAGVAGAAGLALVVDDDLSDFWQDDVRSDVGDDILEVVEDFGSIRYIGAASIGAYGIAEAFGQKREKAAALMTLESLVLAGALTSGIKFVTSRERPTDSDEPLDFFEREENRLNASFPSGHSTHAFSTATVLSEVYGEDNPWVPYVAYPLAAGVGLARINKNRHWLSDILVGGAIGHFVGKMVTRYNPFLEAQGITTAPTVIGETPGVAFTYAF